MRFRAAQITLAAALASAFSASAATAGMNNIHVNTAIGSTRIPDVKARPLTIDANIRLHCHPTRERNELGVWVHRMRCN